MYYTDYHSDDHTDLQQVVDTQTLVLTAADEGVTVKSGAVHSMHRPVVRVEGEGYRRTQGNGRHNVTWI